jgi:LDH2 family malate/lactate/ureidoglycolate dehydrogenase
MLQFTAEQLRHAARAVLSGIGAPEDIAEYLAGSLVENNLMGHDSHGIIRIPIYTQRVEEGRVKPTARPAILRESPTNAVVTGNWGFGQVAVKFSAELAIKKATEANIAAVNVVECNHMGRLGEFSTMIAAHGMIGMVVTGGFSAQFRSVAPFGGAGRALGTNPYSFAVPAGADRPPFLSDFATSIIAEGKVMVARAKGTPVPEGALLDAKGQPSTDPNAYFTGGMLLPFGGHKGYALSLLADLMGSLLGGSEKLGEPPHTQGTFIMALRVDAFRPFSEFVAAVDKRFSEIKATPPAPGFQEVLIPGEPEARAKAQRLKEGIPIPEDTWGKLVATAEKYKVDLKRFIGK